MAEKGETLEKITVERGNPQKVEAVADERITALVEKGGAGNITTKVKLEDKVSLPLVKGDEMGVLEVYQNEEKIAEYSLVAAGDVNKASFRQMVSRFFKKIF